MPRYIHKSCLDERLKVLKQEHRSKCEHIKEYNELQSKFILETRPEERQRLKPLLKERGRVITQYEVKLKKLEREIKDIEREIKEIGDDTNGNMLMRFVSFVFYHGCLSKNLNNPKCEIYFKIEDLYKHGLGKDVFRFLPVIIEKLKSDDFNCLREEGDDYILYLQ